MTSSMQPPLRHILISRTDNIGDVVLSLPLAGYLKSLFPGVRIDFLCRAYAAPVVRRCRFVDRVVELESLGDPATAFAGAGYDTIVFAHPVRKLALAARRSAPTRCSMPPHSRASRNSTSSGSATWVSSARRNQDRRSRSCAQLIMVPRLAWRQRGVGVVPLDAFGQPIIVTDNISRRTAGVDAIPY